MSLTNEDLAAISQLMDVKLGPINSRLDNMEQGQVSINSRLDNMEQGQVSINSRLDALEGRQIALSKDISNLNHTVIPALKVIQEGIEGLQERNRQLDRLEDKVDRHDDRIFALEQVVKPE